MTPPENAQTGHQEVDRQRIDKWMWHARVVKTRTLAQRLVRSGNVRVNRDKVSDASRSVRLGDVLTIALSAQVRVLKVAGFAERRGSATLAADLFEDLTPPPAPRQSSDGPAEHPPSRRPTKKQRRQLTALRRPSPDQ